MVTAAWTPFLDEISRWRDLGRTVEFWWRDDDAGPPSPALNRLLLLASHVQVPLALAAVPEEAGRDAFLDAGPQVTVIQHGVDHRNRAAPGEKKTEFPPTEQVGAAVKRLASGRIRLERAAGPRFLPVLAPPWNRLSAPLLPGLAAAGLIGLSRFGVRKVTNSGLVEVNTHVDIIDWKTTRAFCGVEQALGQAVRHLAARRAGTADSKEATGWLTHHAVHDEACWSFLERLFEATHALDGVHWRRANELFIPARSA